MRSAAPSQGTAERQGRLWGTRAAEWAELEVAQAPLYEEAIRLAGIDAGTTVLDLGCGSGVFLRAAADRGARVAGLDASDVLLEIARARVPKADVRVGEIQATPFADGAFDVVTGFNSFQFAADMTAAVREAGRVARPGGTVVIQVWGRPERCDLTAMMLALAPLRPPTGAAPPPSLSTPGLLEEIAADAGLTPETTFDVVSGLEFGDEATMLSRLLAPGVIVALIGDVGEEPVAAATRAAMAPFRTPGGGYRLENEWHGLIARA